jgi:hypothetical protein
VRSAIEAAEDDMGLKQARRLYHRGRIFRKELDSIRKNFDMNEKALDGLLPKKSGAQLRA